MPDTQIDPEQIEQMRIPSGLHSRSSRRISRAEALLQVGPIMSIAKQTPVYRAGATLQDLPQHNLDRRFLRTLAITNHILGEVCPRGEDRV